MSWKKGKEWKERAGKATWCSVFPHEDVKTCSYFLHQSQIESGQEDKVLRRRITLHVFLIPPSLKLSTSMCPLHRCEYSLTWLDESLHSLITSNGWLVPTKVWGFLINTSQDSFVSDVVLLWSNMIGWGCVGIRVVWPCMCMLRVFSCVHACVCAGSDPFCQEAMKWHLGGSEVNPL